MLIVAGVGVAVGAIFWLRFGTVFAFIPCPIVIWIASGILLRFRQSRRTSAFEAQLGDTIILLSNALKAGLSFAQAMSTVAKNATPPISEEFGRATREIALGIPVDDALQHMVQRNKSEDFDLLVTAVQIQRVVGGNLAEILDTIAYTIRERVRIHGEIRTITAQARMSGMIITLLPIGLALFLFFVQPSVLRPDGPEDPGLGDAGPGRLQHHGGNRDHPEDRQDRGMTGIAALAGALVACSIILVVLWGAHRAFAAGGPPGGPAGPVHRVRPRRPEPGRGAR